MTLRALSIAASGGSALLRRIDLIAGNLANLQTAGYKRSRITFADLAAAGGAGGGVQAQPPTQILDPGRLEPTHRDLDLAIEGDGFFRVLLGDETVGYTRSGRLRVDGQGMLETTAGYRIDPPVTVPRGMDRIVVGPGGDVQGYSPRSPERLEPVGQIELARFPNPSALVPAGESLFRATDASGLAEVGLPGEGSGWIRQGYLEASNVDEIRELAGLLEAERSFELNSKMIQAADEILQNINSLWRKS